MRRSWSSGLTRPISGYNSPRWPKILRAFIRCCRRVSVLAAGVHVHAVVINLLLGLDSHVRFKHYLDLGVSQEPTLWRDSEDHRRSRNISVPILHLIAVIRWPSLPTVPDINIRPPALATPCHDTTPRKRNSAFAYYRNNTTQLGNMMQIL